MAELGFPCGDESEVVDLMFPRDAKLTVGDFMSGIVFDESIDDQSTDGGSVGRAATQRTKQYFRRYVDDVYNGKIGNSTAVKPLTNCIMLTLRPNTRADSSAVKCKSSRNADA
jgi:hypothetical protein